MSDELEIIKKPNRLEVITPDQEKEFEKCMNDVLYFTENYVKISHPKYGRLPFKPWPYQKTMLREFQKNRFSIALTARQMGKCVIGDTFIKVNDEYVKIKKLISLSLKEKIVDFLENLLIKINKN